MQQHFCVAALLCLVALCSAQSCLDLSPSFALSGQSCEELSCANSLSCVNNTCQEFVEGDNCTTDLDCGAGFLHCLSNGKCGVVYRTNGDPCDLSEECLSGKCSNSTGTNLCTATLNEHDACSLSNKFNSYGCPDACVYANDTWMCAAPIPEGGDCSAEWAQWISNPLYAEQSAWLPQMFCASGTACIVNASIAGGNNFNCQRIFSQPEGAPCQSEGIDGTCQYNLTCQKNSSSITNFTCTAYPAPLAKGARTQCELPVSDVTPVCPFGQACLCTSNSTNATCLPYFGSEGCVDYLTDLVNCVAKHGCPFTPVLFPFTGGLNAPFSTEAYPHTCVSLECRVAHANFLCCQNNHTMFSGSASVAKQFSPVNTPSDGYCKLHHGWPNWAIPVIVLSGIVLVVTVIVIIYVVARRRPDADYDPINK